VESKQAQVLSRCFLEFWPQGSDLRLFTHRIESMSPMLALKQLLNQEFRYFLSQFVFKMDLSGIVLIKKRLFVQEEESYGFLSLSRPFMLDR
jgi:hypothetical protein